jgi:hypothetical protein
MSLLTTRSVPRCLLPQSRGIPAICSRHRELRLTIRMRLCPTSTLKMSRALARSELILKSAQVLKYLLLMEAEVTNFKESCHRGHDSVSDLRQSGIGWVAPLVAVAGLLLALAGASGWGESPVQFEFSPEVSPAAESHSSGVLGQDAGPPDGRSYDDAVLVGLRR